jgi:hypothetical protein
MFLVLPLQLAATTVARNSVALRRVPEGREGTTVLHKGEASIENS